MIILSFISLTPSVPSWLGGGVWLMPVIVLAVAMVVSVGTVPALYRAAVRRLITALVLAVVLSAGLIAGELIRMDVPQCASLEPYSAAWFAFGCWWPF